MGDRRVCSGERVLKSRARERFCVPAPRSHFMGSRLIRLLLTHSTAVVFREDRVWEMTMPKELRVLGLGFSSLVRLLSSTLSLVLEMQTHLCSQHQSGESEGKGAGRPGQTH